MKRFLFLPLLFFSFPLFAQVSFQYETRSFTELGLKTNEQIAEYLEIGLSDLLPIFQHNSMGGKGATISPADLYKAISISFNDKNMMALQRVCKELGVPFDRFITVFSRETGETSETDLQMILAMYRIGIKWGIISS